MAQTMTPSNTVPITDGQIDKAVAAYRAMLVKHRGELVSEIVQDVIGQPGFVGEMVGVLRQRVEALSGMIVRCVKVDRIRSNQEAIDAMGRVKYIDGAALATMPIGEGEEVDVYFFKLSHYLSDVELAQEYELRGLEPDPRAQAAVNEADPAFADTHPNGTHWQDASGNWHFVTFDRWHDMRDVRVRRSGRRWGGVWSFGGVRKKKPSAL